MFPSANAHSLASSSIRLSLVRYVCELCVSTGLRTGLLQPAPTAGRRELERVTRNDRYPTATDSSLLWHRSRGYSGGTERSVRSDRDPDGDGRVSLRSPVQTTLEARALCRLLFIAPWVTLSVFGDAPSLAPGES